jgi:cell division protein FtsN
MTQDFAKQHRDAPKAGGASPPRLAWFISGFISGAFMTFLISLWYFVPGPAPSTAIEQRPVAEPEAKVEEMKWDFYEIFPRSSVPVVEEYTTTGSKVVIDDFSWVLQAGSFQNANDADELRATLILMGLDVSIADVNVSGTIWHRVIAGPFETELDRNRAQDKLAQAEIKAMPMKIPR